MFKPGIKLIQILRNKYFLTSVAFLLFILLFSQNNLIERFYNLNELNKLKKQKEYYLKIIKENTEKINLLKNDPKHIEKFAREEYLMKKTDEDVFVFRDKEK